MASTRARILWQSGIPLDRAWLEFASADAKHDYYSLPDDTATPDVDAGEATPKKVIRIIFDLADAAMRAGSVIRQRRDKLRADLIKGISEGKYIVFGYRQFPPSSSSPVEIPGEAFICENADIAWERGIIGFVGKEYEQIRVVSQEVAAVGDLPSKRGRRGSKEIIRAAVNEVIADHSRQKVCEMSRKNACELVRRKIGKPYSPGNGLSDKNLDKYILQQCGHKRLVV